MHAIIGEKGKGTAMCGEDENDGMDGMNSFCVELSRRVRNVGFGFDGWMTSQWIHPIIQTRDCVCFRCDECHISHLALVVLSLCFVIVLLAPLSRK